jgi:outer membrane protein assembly factor BamB
MKQALLPTLFLISVILISAEPSYMNRDWNRSTDSSQVRIGDYIYQGPETDTWSTFGHDLNNTRTSLSPAPHSPNKLWQFSGQFEGDEELAVADDRVFIGSEIVNEFYCLNKSDGTLLWKFVTDGTASCCPAISAGQVIVGALSGSLYCLNEMTGIPIWNVTLSEQIYHSSPAIANGRIFIGGYGGDFTSHLYCLDLIDGHTMWTCETRAITSSPAVTNGKVFVGSTGSTGTGGGKVYCINETEGQNIWTYTTGDHIDRSSPTVVNGRVFVGSFDDHFYCLDENTGTQIWNYALSSWTWSSPAVEGGKVFTGSEDGKIYALNATDGKLIWTNSYPYQLLCSPSVADGMVFMNGPYLDGLMALNATDGTLIWRYPNTAIPGTSSAAIVDGKIFASYQGEVCCFGSPYKLEIKPSFVDNQGHILNLSPSEWSVQFPNETVQTIASDSAVFEQAQNGNYSIVSIIWQGSEVVPDEKPTVFLDSNKTWNPEINCRLPTLLTIDLSTSTSFIGFWVNISGRLADYENMSINGAQILMQYSLTGTDPWNAITADHTEADGSYSALWVPAATGDFAVRATYQGNQTYPSSNSFINLAVKPYEERNVFSVTSNSSISELAFDTTDWALSLKATGPNGTSGFTKVIVAKSLVANSSNIQVYLDNKQTEFHVSSIDESWLITVTYEHSTHTLVVDLGANAIDKPLPGFIIVLSIVIISLMVILASLIYMRSRRTRQTSNRLRSNERSVKSLSKEQSK